MAIKINFDLAGNPELSTFILAKKNGDKIGMLNVQKPVLNDCLNSASEITFNVYKTLNGEDCVIWDEIVDFKLVWCKEWDVWFEIKVEINDSDEENIYKSIIGTSLCEAELSQVSLHNIEINTEDDIARDDYIKPTVFYHEDKSISLLNRILEKIPHYTIGHIDTSLKNVQKTFKFDDISIYDALQEIAEEVGCIFIFDSGTDENGKIARKIKAYDLMTYCTKCGNRDTFTSVCTNCGCTDKTYFTNPYGEDTNIFISKENFADEITYSTNIDKVKNCFKLEAGDDLMTATIRSCNPNGSDYIWYISDSMRKDMPSELQEKLAAYDNEYEEFQSGGKFKIQTSSKIEPYYIPSTLFTAYNEYYDNYKDYNDSLKMINDIDSITNYSKLMTVYYNTVDMLLLLESGLMPCGSQCNNANEVVESLYNNLISPVGIIGYNENIRDSSIETAIKYMVEAVIDPYYTVKVNTTEISSNKEKWYGTVTITNIHDSEDSCISDDLIVELCDYISHPVSYVSTKLQAALKATSVVNYGIRELFAYYTDYDNVNQSEKWTFKIDGETNFKNKLKVHCLNNLVSFRDACQTVLDILIEQGLANKSSNYYTLYSDFNNRLTWIEETIEDREEEIANVTSLQDYIVDIRNSIQSALNFEKYLGSHLWKEFLAYRREDKYFNSNYISDGLTNNELIVRATEFIEIATQDLYKSGELQHKISSSLKNLLLMDEFKPLLNYFELGNYLRVEIDGNVYRLRLIEYKIDFDNLEDITVEFSDIAKMINGVSDLESILNQSKSMASSYDNIARQAKQGSKGYGRMNDWVEKGLDVTNTKIVNEANNNVMTWDEHGILMREYNPVTETYSNKQVKITNKGLYVTDDSWTSAKVGVGNFIYYNPTDKKYYEAFGIIADTLVGNLILGKEVGIYTERNDITIDDNGIIISNQPYSDYSSNGTSATVITMNPNSNSPFKITYGNNTVMRVNNSGELYINRKLNVHNHFIVDNDGNIDMDGEITLGGNINMTGNIIWGDNSGVTYILYSSAKSPSAPINKYNSYELTSSDTSWHKQFTPSKDKTIARYVNGSWQVEPITFLTHIDATGIYTGTLTADKIQGEHISTRTFTNADVTNDYGYIDLYKQMIFFNENDSGNTKGDTKMAIGFLKGTQYNEPIIVMGAGDGNGSNIGYINKGSDNFSMYYKVDDKNLSYIKMYKDNESGKASIRINGVEFPQQSNDEMVYNFMVKANDWNNKLEAVEKTIKDRKVSAVQDGSGKSINISPENLGEMFTVNASTGVISLRSDVVLSWNAVYVLYAQTALAKPTKAYSTYYDSSVSWHKVFASTDYYASYSYDGGKTWSDAVKIRGTDGKNGADGADGASGEINYDTLYGLLEESYGITHTEITGTSIQSPTIQGGTIAGSTIIGGTLIAAGNGINDSDAANAQDRIVIEGNAINTYNGVSQKNGVSIYANSSDVLNYANTMGAIIFYHEDTLQGSIFATESSIMIQPKNEGCSLVLGDSGRTTYAKGRWNFAYATVSGLKVTFG